MKIIGNKVIFDTPEDWRVGLLRYHEPPEGKKFVFIFPDEKVRIFHTTGMEFNIDIHFYDANKKLVKSYRNCKPNIVSISSEKPAKYVVEIPSVTLQEKHVPRDLRHPILTLKPVGAAFAGILGGAGAGIAAGKLTKSAGIGLGTYFGVGISLSRYLAKLAMQTHKECEKIKKQDKVKYYQCRIKGSREIINKLKQFMSKCSGFKKPKKCRDEVLAHMQWWKIQLRSDQEFLQKIHNKK